MVQLVARTAAIEIDDVAVVYMKNVRLAVRNTKIKEYDDSGEPDVLVAGDRTYTFSAEYGYADTVNAALAIAGTPTDVVIYPEGKTDSKPMLTLAGCILDFELNYGRVGVILTRIEGEGKSLTPGTYSAP